MCEALLLPNILKVDIYVIYALHNLYAFMICARRHFIFAQAPSINNEEYAHVYGDLCYIFSCNSLMSCVDESEKIPTMCVEHVNIAGIKGETREEDKHNYFLLHFFPA